MRISDHLFKFSLLKYCTHSCLLSPSLYVLAAYTHVISIVRTTCKPTSPALFWKAADHLHLKGLTKTALKCDQAHTQICKYDEI